MLYIFVASLFALNGSGLSGSKTPSPLQTPQSYSQSLYTGKIVKAISSFPKMNEKPQDYINIPFMKLPEEDEGTPGEMTHRWQYIDLDISPKTPGIVNQFEGITYTGWNPPDVQVAANSSYIVEVVNSYIQVFDKSGNHQYGTTLYSFFSSLNPSVNFVFDPKVAYDPSGNRWIVLALYRNSSNLDSYYFLAISQTSDPTGNWYFYALDATTNGSTPTNTWADYPGLGFNDWGIFITSNQYTWTDTFQYSKVRILDKASAYNGTLSSFYDIWGVSLASSWKPAQCMSSSSTEYLMRSYWGNSSIIRLWKITGNASSPALSSRYDVTVRAYQLPPGASQRGGSASLDVGDCRMQDVTYFNGVIYGSFNEQHPSISSVVSVRYLEIDTSMTVIKDVTFGNTSINYFYPRIAASYNFSVLTCAASGDSLYAGFVYTTRELPSGTFSSFSWVRQGYAYFYHPDSYGRNRWGDYFGAYLDPSDSSVWVAGQYATSSGNWSTYIAQIKDTVISTSPYLVIDSMSIDDDNSGNSSGNGNGIVESGESIEMKIRLLNTGNATATGVSAVLRTSDSTITITDSTETYPNISSGNSEWCYYDFNFFVSSSATTHNADFSIFITSDQGNWSYPFQIPIYQPSTQPPPPPFNVVAGNGFKDLVPITWSDTSECHIFKIYRSQASGGPYTLLDSIDIQYRNYAPSTDYVDTSVTPGVEYFYVVTAIKDGLESGFSAEASSIPSDTGWVFHSPYSDIQPTIDGTITSSEWADAESLVISNPWNPYPIVIRIKNDSIRAYFSISAYGVTFIDAINMGFYYDLGNDGMWPPDTLGTLEGGFWFNQYTGSPYYGFVPVFGSYPDSLDFGEYSPVPGVQFEYDTLNGTYSAEISVDMQTSPMATFPGDTMGFWFYFLDYMVYDTTYYGFGGVWPYGAVWTASQTYGDLIFGDAGPYSCNDTLLLLPDTTGPGGFSEIPIRLINQNSVGGIQLTVGYDTTKLSVDTVLLDTSLSNFSLSFNAHGDSIAIILVSLSGDSVSTGYHSIAKIVFDTDSTIPPGDSVYVQLLNATLSDPQGNNLPVYYEGAWIFVFGMKGDLNQDGVVNVLDVVRAINIALGRSPAPSSYEQWAGDMNDDGTINVLDIVAIINLSLGGSKIAGVEGGTADLRIENGDVVLNTTTPVAGIQLELTGRIEDLRSNIPGADVYSESSGDHTKVIIVFTNGGALPAGESNILQINGNAIIRNAIVSDPEAHNVDVNVEIPDLMLNPVNPNPANRSGTLSFVLPDEMHVKLRILDVSGRVLKELENRKLGAGTHSVKFSDLRPGVYFVELVAGGKRRIGKFVVR